MNVVGYTYDAAVHCPSCMFDYAREVPYSEYDFGEYSDEDIASFSPGIIDLNKAIELEVIRDSENNPIHPIFDTSESDVPEHCDDCCVFIDTSWTGEAVSYVIEALQNYIENGNGTEEVLDEWAANLTWCGVSEEDNDILATYNILRKTEQEALPDGKA